METKAIDFEFAEVKKKGDKQLEGVGIGIDIMGVRELDPKTARIAFVFTAKYPPNESYLRIGGIADFSGSDVVVASRSWEVNKKLSGPLGEQVLNNLNYAASINAVLLARVFNLTPPVTPPVLRLPALTNPLSPEVKKKK